MITKRSINVIKLVYTVISCTKKIMKIIGNTVRNVTDISRTLLVLIVIKGKQNMATPLAISISDVNSVTKPSTPPCIKRLMCVWNITVKRARNMLERTISATCRPLTWNQKQSQNSKTSIKGKTESVIFSLILSAHMMTYWNAIKGTNQAKARNVLIAKQRGVDHLNISQTCV